MHCHFSARFHFPYASSPSVDTYLFNSFALLSSTSDFYCFIMPNIISNNHSRMIFIVSNFIFSATMLIKINCCFDLLLFKPLHKPMPLFNQMLMRFLNLFKSRLPHCCTLFAHFLRLLSFFVSLKSN